MAEKIFVNKEIVNISNIFWWTRKCCYYYTLSIDIFYISSRERTFSKYYLFLKLVLNLNNWEVVESCIIQEKFEYTKGVIKSRKSKDWQYNGQQKKDRQYNGLQKKDWQYNGTQYPIQYLHHTIQTHNSEYCFTYKEIILETVS